MLLNENKGKDEDYMLAIRLCAKLIKGFCIEASELNTYI